MIDWRERLTGTDPFDALRGDHVPRFLLSNPRLRQAVVQLRKRAPIDLAPLLGVRPFLMAKTVGAFLAVRSRSVDSDCLSDAIALAALAEQADGCLGNGRWGYEFDVQTRWAFYPAGSPNLIATVFCARGFAEAGIAFGRTDWLERLHDSARWVDAELLGSGSFVRYVPDSSRLVHNANLLGCALIGVSACLRGDDEGVDRALNASRMSTEAQLPSGGWAYGEGAGLEWEDNFHTGYVLGALLQLWLVSGDERVERALRLGVRYYEETFFGPAGEPWFGPNKRFPLDIHSAGTAVDVLSRLATWGFTDRDTAIRCADWTERHMVATDGGSTYARRLRFCTDRRHFVRWGDAHWALGRSALDTLLSGERVALEQALFDMRSDRKSTQNIGFGGA